MEILFLGKCEAGFVENENHCYKLSSQKLSWKDARYECLNLNGNYDLVTIDNLKVYEFLKNYTNHWIGLYSQKDKSDFKWVDGTKVEFGDLGSGRDENLFPWAASQSNVRFAFSFYLTLPFEYSFLDLYNFKSELH